MEDSTQPPSRYMAEHYMLALTVLYLVLLKMGKLSSVCFLAIVSLTFGVFNPLAVWLLSQFAFREGAPGMSTGIPFREGIIFALAAIVL